MSFDIIRFYAAKNKRKKVLKNVSTEKEAIAYCDDPELSSETCTSKEGKARTRKHGTWFVGFQSR
jgi:hypothetical protein